MVQIHSPRLLNTSTRFLVFRLPRVDDFVDSTCSLGAQQLDLLGEMADTPNRCVDAEVLRMRRTCGRDAVSAG